MPASPFPTPKQTAKPGSQPTQKPEKQAQTGYWLGEPYWNKGIATEAARTLINFAFDILAIEKLTAGHYINNPASGRVLTKSGFEKTGESTRPCLAQDKDMASIDYHLTRERWQAQNKPL